ncbi:hypothetical protein [Myxococcus sp. CA040A]|uniref:hypothetical protein n=1 Tax=Myxococcus sp. CA040A TaxID=2741738 RepID=UPI0020C5B5D3|nr:hypothetical protein [Myxococcus sp. CA040A]
MADRPRSPWRRGTELLTRAAHLYDAPGSTLAHEARGAWRGGFASSATWMAQALAQVRGRPVLADLPHAGRWGALKYGGALLAALGCWGLAVVLGLPHALGFVLAVLAFYAAEVQGLFLFPLLMDGAEHPWRSGRALLRRAGGTPGAVGTVLMLAGVMLLGGLVGRGWVRCWCLGCLAVVHWYEDLRA